MRATYKASIVSSDPLREEDTSARESTAFADVVEFAVGLNASSSFISAVAFPEPTWSLEQQQQTPAFPLNVGRPSAIHAEGPT